jgi:hypothetical protein
MTARRLRKWSAIAIAAAVALWIVQALIGMNWYEDEEAYPWFLRVVQWIALGLVLLTLPLLLWAMTRTRPREDL